MQPLQASALLVAERRDLRELSFDDGQPTLGHADCFAEHALPRFGIVRLEVLAAYLLVQLVGFQQLVDLGEGESHDFAQLLDLLQALDVARVEQAVGALHANGRPQEAALFVVPNGPRRQPNLPGDVANRAQLGNFVVGQSLPP